VKKYVNLDAQEKRESTQQQIDANQAYNKQLNYINEGLEEKEVVLSDDIETYRKILKITADMTTEDSNIFKIIYTDQSKVKAEDRDEIIHAALRFHNKKRKEIVKIATGRNDFTKDQEVALCGALFRLAVAVPAMLALDGKSL